MLRAASNRLAAAPINQERFERILSSIWWNSGYCPQLGLAISGGVDSMALASLCSRVKGSRLGRLSFAAFVVDHGARNGSNEEAQRVASILDEIDIKTRVLKLEWDTPSPELLSNFEMQARQKRFRALGRACRDMNINTLMLAHHADDQAETVMHRLSAGYGGAGLRAIKYESQIPECYGIYGVDGSGVPRTVMAGSLQSGSPHNVRIEDGGVTIYRPLLDFTKSQLLATCGHNEISWFEDVTNTDPTLTPRNAIRHMFENYRLPAALASHALVQLADKAASLEEQRADFAEYCYNQCQIKLNLRSGAVSIQIPSKVRGLILEGGDVEESKRRAALLMRRFISLASPQNVVSLQDLDMAVQLAFLELRQSAQAPRKLHNPASVAKTLFEVSGESFSVMKDDTRPNLNEVAAPDTRSCNIVRSTPTTEQIRQTQVTVLESAATRSSVIDYVWSDWSLFDGRFWIRIRYRPYNLSPGRPIQVRFLVHADMQELHQSVSNIRVAKHLDKLLKLHGPSRARFTLPVIVEKFQTVTEGLIKPARVNILALPSLGWSSRGWHEWKEGDDLKSEPEGWKYEIRYKKVDVGKGKEHTFVV